MKFFLKSACSIEGTNKRRNSPSTALSERFALRPRGGAARGAGGGGAQMTATLLRPSARAERYQTTSKQLFIQPDTTPRNI
ncbi:hypothetical protein EVAR_38232_1 [Eumeta japonica]|uniref:Uncharacterized protein n=1 Tax=Eumeta variegata TaxID=151549 RepID=A0A4C1XGK7_EUMVA|nr:hypothetical protein EVAR_38232_1 [Eumeta japonica]